MNKKLSVSDAAARGDHLGTLMALRDRVADAIDDPDTPPRDLAALSRQLTHILSELKLAESAKANTPLAGLFDQFEQEFAK